MNTKGFSYSLKLLTENSNISSAEGLWWFPAMSSGKLLAWKTSLRCLSSGSLNMLLQILRALAHVNLSNFVVALRWWLKCFTPIITWGQPQTHLPWPLYQCPPCSFWGNLVQLSVSLSSFVSEVPTLRYLFRQCAYAVCIALQEQLALPIWARN